MSLLIWPSIYVKCLLCTFCGQMQSKMLVGKESEYVSCIVMNILRSCVDLEKSTTRNLMESWNFGLLWPFSPS